jgi:hypothetical protein
MVSGIYKIVNLNNNKCYIGSSRNIKDRWRRHKKDLKNNCHHSIILQRSYNKHGKTKFSYEIIELCEVDKLLEREQHYIIELEPVYNICRIAGSSLGVKQSKEICEKKRQYALENNIKPPESTWKDKQKPIQMFNKQTDEFIKEFTSIAEACRFIGKNSTYASTLSSCAIGKRKTAFGYKWKFVETSPH